MQIPEVVLLKIFSFLSSTELNKVAHICKSWNTVSRDSKLWKRLVQLELTQNSNSNTIRSIIAHGLQPVNDNYKLFFQQLMLTSTTVPEIFIKGLSASSTDYSFQGIDNTTLDSRDYELLFAVLYLWSSKGSKTTDTDEWLLYKFKKPFSIITKIRVVAHKASDQTGEPIFAPRRVQFFIGFGPNEFHFKSVIYDYPLDDAPIKFEIGLPNIVIGSFLKIQFYGKRTLQASDNLYYLTIKNVCTLGYSLGSLKFPELKESVLNYVLQPHFMNAIYSSRKNYKFLSKIDSTDETRFCQEVKRAILQKHKSSFSQTVSKLFKKLTS